METEEKLCIKVLRTLQQMLVKRNKYGERVSTMICAHADPTPRLAEPTLGHPGVLSWFCPGPSLGKGTLVTFVCLGRATCCGKCS